MLICCHVNNPSFPSLLLDKASVPNNLQFKTPHLLVLTAQKVVIPITI